MFLSKAFSSLALQREREQRRSVPNVPPSSSLAFAERRTLRRACRLEPLEPDNGDGDGDGGEPSSFKKSFEEACGGGGLSSATAATTAGTPPASLACGPQAAHVVSLVHEAIDEQTRPEALFSDIKLQLFTSMEALAQSKPEFDVKHSTLKDLVAAASASALRAQQTATVGVRNNTG